VPSERLFRISNYPSLIRLTDEGRTLADKVIEAQAENGRRLLGSLDAMQQEAIGNLMRQLILSLEAPSPEAERHG
jgi:hypothetical protein